MITTIPEPDGRIAIYQHGRLLGRARNQAHADDWIPRWLENQKGMADLAWRIADRVWARLTPAERRELMVDEAREAA